MITKRTTTILIKVKILLTNDDSLTPNAKATEKNKNINCTFFYGLSNNIYPLILL